MNRKIGIWMMLLGLLLLLSAGGLLMYNSYEDERAGAAAREQLALLVSRIEENKEEEEGTSGSADHRQELPQEQWFQEILTQPPGEEEEPLPTMAADSDGYIGYISMPTIDIELPIMSDWDYDKLLRSPCYYYGTVETEDLVLMAHNYTRHFGKLSLLDPGDPVYFVDIQGVTTQYVVVHQEILPPKCVPELTNGNFDLTLFTCTYSGANRVTVRCDRVE